MADDDMPNGKPKTTLNFYNGMAPLVTRKELRAQRADEERELRSGFKPSDHLKAVAARDLAFAGGSMAPASTPGPTAGNGAGGSTEAPGVSAGGDGTAPAQTDPNAPAAPAAAAGWGAATGDGATTGQAAPEPAAARAGRRRANA